MIGQIFLDSMDRSRHLIPMRMVDKNYVDCKVYWQSTSKDGTKTTMSFGGMSKQLAKLFENDPKNSRYGFIQVEDKENPYEQSIAG
jgi:hypothetical protein